LLTTWEAMSKTRLPSQAPMGTVTSIGCSGCPYGPVSSALTGCFDCCIPVTTKLSRLLSYYTNESWSYFPARSSPD
jgi:hypothetical protein